MCTIFSPDFIFLHFLKNMILLFLFMNKSKSGDPTSYSESRRVQFLISDNDEWIFVTTQRRRKNQRNGFTPCVMKTGRSFAHVLQLESHRFKIFSPPFFPFFDLIDNNVRTDFLCKNPQLEQWQAEIAVAAAHLQFLIRRTHLRQTSEHQNPAWPDAAWGMRLDLKSDAGLPFSCYRVGSGNPQWPDRRWKFLLFFANQPPLCSDCDQHTNKGAYAHISTHERRPRKNLEKRNAQMRTFRLAESTHQHRTAASNRFETLFGWSIFIFRKHFFAGTIWHSLRVGLRNHCRTTKITIHLFLVSDTLPIHF